MTYTVKEIFDTLQGEGANAGRPAVFCRFAGCNLWSGLERDRETAICKFCDTDCVGTDGTRGGKYPDAAQLVATIASDWPVSSSGKRLVACTGGESLLRLGGQELKVGVPQPFGFDHLAALDFEQRFVQAMDGPLRIENMKFAINRCMQYPEWRLSVRTHKVIGIR